MSQQPTQSPLSQRPAQAYTNNDASSTFVDQQSIKTKKELARLPSNPFSLIEKAKSPNNNTEHGTTTDPTALLLRGILVPLNKSPKYAEPDDAFVINKHSSRILKAHETNSTAQETSTKMMNDPTKTTNAPTGTQGTPPRNEEARRQKYLEEFPLAMTGGAKTPDKQQKNSRKKTTTNTTPTGKPTGKKPKATDKRTSGLSALTSTGGTNESTDKEMTANPTELLKHKNNARVNPEPSNKDETPAAPPNVIRETNPPTSDDASVRSEKTMTTNNTGGKEELKTIAGGSALSTGKASTNLVGIYLATTNEKLDVHNLIEVTVKTNPHITEFLNFKRDPASKITSQVLLGMMDDVKQRAILYNDFFGMETEVHRPDGTVKAKRAVALYACTDLPFKMIRDNVINHCKGLKRLRALGWQVFQHDDTETIQKEIAFVMAKSVKHGYGQDLTRKIARVTTAHDPSLNLNIRVVPSHEWSYVNGDEVRVRVWALKVGKSKKQEAIAVLRHLQATGGLDGLHIKFKDKRYKPNTYNESVANVLFSENTLVGVPVLNLTLEGATNLRLNLTKELKPDVLISVDETPRHNLGKLKVITPSDEYKSYRSTIKKLFSNRPDRYTNLSKFSLPEVHAPSPSSVSTTRSTTSTISANPYGDLSARMTSDDRTQGLRNAKIVSYVPPPPGPVRVDPMAEIHTAIRLSTYAQGAAQPNDDLSQEDTVVSKLTRGRESPQRSRLERSNHQHANGRHE